MRTMKESTYDAIKQGKMLGGNKFNYELKIEGISDYGNAGTIFSNVLKVNSNALDYAVRYDGKILVAYAIDLILYLKVVNTEKDMVSVYDSANGGAAFYSLSEKKVSPYFALLKLRSGKILLFINDPGHFANGIPYALKVYESANGLGDDFVLKTVINSSARASYITNNLKHLIGKPVEGPDNEIWILAGVRRTVYGSDYSDHHIYKSVDGGITWSLKYVFDSTITGSNLAMGFRSMTVVGSSVFVVVGNWNFNGNKEYLYISTNFGETWSWVSLNFSNLPPQNYSNGLERELIDFKYHRDEFLYMIAGTADGKANIYKTKPVIQVTYEYLNNMANWILVKTGISRFTYQEGWLSISLSGIIHYIYLDSSSTYMIDSGVYIETVESPFKASSITISKSRGGANTASIRVNNKDGVVNPRNPDGPLYGFLKLNRKIIIKQGYGDDIVESFTGMIDSIKMSTFPQVADIALRDNLKLALDQKITKNGINTIDYTNQPIENIVRDLCICAGLEIGYIEPTGISIEKSFSWESYADAFQFLSDLASFEFLTDEVGKFHFRRDYQPNNMFVAWSFEEGVDITNLTYEINDNDLYYAVKVYGKAADDVIIIYDAPFLDAPEFNILPQKILKIDATEASSHTELKKIAERAISTMRSRTRVIDFSTVGVPHLQIGDFIQLFESSTGSADVYRLSSMALNMSETEFTMNCKAYYYGDSVVPIELPNETAVQTANATLNLIPEMTSNVAPSGVARASSVYILYTNDYKPWNAFNSSTADLFWDASVNHGWIEYEFPKKMVIDKYMVKARQLLGYNDAMPKAWTFEAFDGTKWIVLDTRSVQTGWGVNEQRSYTFVNTVAYPKYRLNVSGNNGYSRMQIEQLAMYFRGGV